MKEIGDKLRQAREKKNISINEIQEITKIRLRYLEAIESGDLEIIPGEVYRKGFITNYANAVGLDGNELIREYNRFKAGEMTPPETKPVAEVEAKTAPVKQVQVKTETKPENPVKVTSEKTPVAKPRRENHRKPLPINRVLIWVAAGAVLAGICLVLILNGGIIKTKTIATEQQRVTEEVRPDTPVSQPAPASMQEDQSETTVQQIYPAPITVYAEFSTEVWVQVKADGQVKYPGSGMTFNARSPKQLWTASSEMVLRIGNPAGMKLILNGKDLGPLGEAGKAKTITLTVNGMVES